MGGRRLVERREVCMGLRVVPVGQGWALWGRRWGAGPAAGPPGPEEEGWKGAGMNPEPLGWGLGGGRRTLSISGATLVPAAGG